MNGILLVDKPKGWTSFDVVSKVRSILRTAARNQELEGSKLIPNSYLLVSSSKKIKVGHTGTLDPLATGLLVLVVGSYTKKATELSKLDKTYEVAMKLGATSTTGDAEGIITPVKNHYNSRSCNLLIFSEADKVVKDFAGEIESFDSAQDKPSREKLSEIIKSFVGEIEQTPPAYSAIKVNGQRAYKLARQGKKVKLEPRKVKIYSITDIKLSFKNSQKTTIVNKSSNFEEMRFKAKVSSGTYIRSLVEDIGQKLGTGAYMSDLKRTEVGKFVLDDAIPAESVTIEQISSHLRFT